MMDKPVEGEKVSVSDRSGFEMEYQRAQALHQAGRLDEAKALYQRILDTDSENVAALHFLGILLHQQGNSDDALSLINKAIKLQPGEPGQHTNAGKVYADLKRLDVAVEHFRKAVELAPGNADTHANLGLSLTMVGADAEAMTCFETALNLNPSQPLANIEMGRLLFDRSKFEAAEECFSAYLAQVPNDALIIGNLARVIQCLGRLQEAEGLFMTAMDLATGSTALRQILKHHPSRGRRHQAARQHLRKLLRHIPDMWPIGTGFACNLAKRGLMDQAMGIFHDIVGIVPGNAALCHDIATTMIGLNRFKDAIEFFDRAIGIDPEFAMAHNGLGSVYVALEQPAVAVPALIRAVTIKPGMVEPHINLCRAFRNMDDLDQAKRYADQAIALPNYSPRHSPTFRQTYSAVCDFEGLAKLGDVWSNCDQVSIKELSTIFLGLLVVADDGPSVARFHHLVRQWAANVESLADAAPLPAAPGHDTDGRIRVGILSSDLYRHSVAKFLIPLIRSYDRTRFAFYCYTPFQAAGDPIQDRFMAWADKFTFVAGKTEREIAETIQGDGVDILLELNGFTQASRIATLAYKPAPVQMSWLGYPFSCGLKAIDYVVMDRFVKPADADRWVEAPLIMPETWLCYGLLHEEPIAPDLPMDRDGVVTFGTLNNPYKYTQPMIALWAEVLKRVPDSLFLVVRPEAGSRCLRDNLVHEFARHGISADRLSFIDNKLGDKTHLAYYNEIDISLDTFPLTGGTTTCEAIWMGVPVVTLVGEAFHQRISYSDLMQCGLDEFCTFSPDDYVARAVALAGSPDRLRELRHGLRETMRASPLCDETGFVRQFQDMLVRVADIHGLRSEPKSDVPAASWGHGQ